MRLPIQDFSQSRRDCHIGCLPHGPRFYGRWDSTSLSFMDQRQAAKHFHSIVPQNQAESEKMDFTRRCKCSHPIGVSKTFGKRNSKIIKNTHTHKNLPIILAGMQVSPNSLKDIWNSKALWLSSRRTISEQSAADGSNQDKKTNKTNKKNGQVERW